MKKLENYKKINPFKVPENYFDNLKSGVMDALPKQETPPKAILRKRMLTWVAAAAVLCGILVSSNFLFKQHSAKTLNLGMSDMALDQDDYINYFEEQSAESTYQAMFYENEY